MERSWNTFISNEVMMPRGCENPIDDSEDAFDNPIQAYDILIAGFFQFYLFYLFLN